MALDRGHQLPQEESSLLQDVATQVQNISALEARHAAESTALHSRQSTEAAELQARQAQEMSTALNRMLEMQRQVEAKVRLEQNNLREASIHVLMDQMTGPLGTSWLPLFVQGRESLAAEIAQMTASGVAAGDILELNIAGTFMSTTRETLTQVGPQL